MAWQHCANCGKRSSDQSVRLNRVNVCPLNLVKLKQGDQGDVCYDCFALVKNNLRETAKR